MKIEKNSPLLKPLRFGCIEQIEEIKRIEKLMAGENLNKYRVTMKYSGYCDIVVTAPDEESAENLASEYRYDYDVEYQLENIDIVKLSNEDLSSIDIEWKENKTND